MNIQTNAGIVYPENTCVEAKITPYSCPSLPFYVELPHASWNKVESVYNTVFSKLGNVKPSHIFVLAPLHKGQVGPDDSFCVYSYEDCFINNQLIVKNNEVCSEEYSFEILENHINAYFPEAKVAAFFAPAYDDKLNSFVNDLQKEFSNSLFIVSNNKETNCGLMWINVLGNLKQAFLLN